jgi:hypothetical protein
MTNPKIDKEDLLEVPKSFENPIPKFLLIVYVVLPIWGIYWLYSYWDGSHGALDRGHWHELQVKANTTIYEKNRSIDESELEWEMK